MNTTRARIEAQDKIIASLDQLATAEAGNAPLAKAITDERERLAKKYGLPAKAPAAA